MRCSKKDIVLRPVKNPTKSFRAEEKPVIKGFGGLCDWERERIRKSPPNAWSYEEVRVLKKMHRQGHDVETIANKLPKRTLTAVEAKLRSMKKRGEL